MKKISPSKILFGLTVGILAACSDAKPDSSHRNSDRPSTAKSPDTSQTSAPKIDAQSEQSSGETTAPTIRSAESHMHGDAELAIVVEGNVVTIELDTPLYNLLGFEHEPESDTQKDSVERVEAQLGRGGELFVFNESADCAIKSAQSDVHLYEHHDEHRGTDEHADHEEDDHAEDEDHDENHKDIILQYEFSCQQPSSLTNVNVNLFEFFDELSEVDVTYLGPSTQRQVRLTPNNAKMDMQP